MPAPKVRKYSGDIRIWRIANDGSHVPVIPDATDPFGNQPIEANAQTFSYEEGDEVTIKSKRRGARYNQPIYSEQEPGTTSLSLQLLEMPNTILARALFAEISDATVAAGAVTDEPIAVTHKDAPLTLPDRFIAASPAPVVKKGATTLVAGTDYKIDQRTGTIRVLGNSVAVGDTILVSYTREAVDGTLLLGGAKPRDKFYITGDMEDRNSGEQGYLEVFQANLGVDGDIDWLAAEPLSPTLTGPLLVPAGAPAPYTFRVYEQAV